MAYASHHVLEYTRFSTMFSGCVRLPFVEEGRIASIAVVHVDDIFAVGLKKSRCDVFRDELNRMVPVKNLGELRWFGGCHYTREREMGTLTISQKTFADELVKKYCVTSTQSVPLRVGVKLEEFNEDEMVENGPFRELVGSLMWLSISTRPDIANAVRAVACSASCCKVLYSAESHPLEDSPWHLGVH